MLNLEPMTKKRASLPPKHATRISDKVSPNRLAPVSKANRDFEEHTISLPENHGWKSSPGYLIFVANKGEVRLDYPENWIIDRTPPGNGMPDTLPSAPAVVLPTTRAPGAARNAMVVYSA